MERLRILVTPALRSHSQRCSRIMPKRHMCSGGGDGSRGGSGGFWQDNFTWKPTKFSLGGIATVAAGVYIYNDIANRPATLEKNIRKHQETMELCRRDIEHEINHYTRALELLKGVNLVTILVQHQSLQARVKELERWVASLEKVMMTCAAVDKKTEKFLKDVAGKKTE